MKKRILILFFIISLMFGIENIFAENKLKYKNDDGYYIVVDKDKSENVGDKEIFYTVSDYKLPDVNKDVELQSIHFYASKKETPVIKSDKWWSQLKVCVDGHTDNSFVKFMDWATGLEVNNTEYAWIFTDSMLIKDYNFSLDDEVLNWYEQIFSGNATNCVDLFPELSSSSVKESDLIASCSFYDETLFSVGKILNGYDSKSASEKINILNEYNVYIDELKQTCNTVMKYQNYYDTCLLRCDRLQEDLDSWDEIIGSASKNGECGFSKRLLVWISNILRWIKYILPVIVIVMGILDFIKAIGADKDDEMKKAQGRFIKRLIAAALVFIIPLIIEFVLDKMGFGYDSCGLF